MSNITLSVPDDILRNARIVAAERSTTVDALVQAYLVQLSDNSTKIKVAMAELRAMIEVSEARLGQDFVWDRKSSYGR
jgi:acetolactate synthase small subunit